MTQAPPKDVGASVRARLLSLARERSRALFTLSRIDLSLGSSTAIE